MIIAAIQQPVKICGVEGANLLRQLRTESAVMLRKDGWYVYASKLLLYLLFDVCDNIINLYLGLELILLFDGFLESGKF